MIFNVPSSFKGSNEGERKVHERLAQLFPGKKYFALHSVGLSQHQEKVNGECDFVIISDLGIFCLEVKGGPVERKVLASENNETRKKNDLWILWVPKHFWKNHQILLQYRGCIVKKLLLG